MFQREDSKPSDLVPRASKLSLHVPLAKKEFQIIDIKKRKLVPPTHPITQELENHRKVFPNRRHHAMHCGTVQTLQEAAFEGHVDKYNDSSEAPLMSRQNQ
ncbi:hypothetical protein CEXT_691811 [Caerostris extrusa]|uniref:Uncharacterized protein n=1 Tax=Caerostris extrusa TaxID=172846 RepID=A0AAV4VFD8_CAEEX|nr:hypothetical protein CEXT_691811 [Caerostris extrusa]